MVRDPWAVLGLEPGATRAEIDGAARRLMAEHHPDRMVGRTPEEVARGESRSREISAAAAELRELIRLTGTSGGLPGPGPGAASAPSPPPRGSATARRPSSVGARPRGGSGPGFEPKVSADGEQWTTENDEGIYFPPRPQAPDPDVAGGGAPPRVPLAIKGAAVVGVLLIVVMIVSGLTTDGQPGPPATRTAVQQAAGDYWTAIRAGDGGTAWDLTERAFQRQYPRDQMVAVVSTCAGTQPIRSVFGITNKADDIWVVDTRQPSGAREPTYVRDEGDRVGVMVNDSTLVALMGVPPNLLASTPGCHPAPPGPSARTIPGQVQRRRA